jgi:hypothetical protein
MKPSERKRQLVEELSRLQGRISVEHLYGFPRQNDTQEWLADVASIFKNLDEGDYQEIVRLSKIITPTEIRINRIKAAHEIYNFVRRKVAEYKRYDFDVEESSLPSSKTYPRLMFGEQGKNGQPGGGGTILINGQVINISNTAKISAAGGDSYTTQGTNSPIVLNLSRIDNLISRLETEIENNYVTFDKEEVKTIVKELKASAVAGNESRFKQLAGVLLTKGAEVAQIASLIIQLLTLVSGVK